MVEYRYQAYIRRTPARGNRGYRTYSQLRVYNAAKNTTVPSLFEPKKKLEVEFKLECDRDAYAVQEKLRIKARVEVLQRRKLQRELMPS